MSASDEKPKKLDPIDEMFYLDRIDVLTVDLAECREALELKEEPPCEDGFPWVACVVSGLVGALAVALIE